MLKRDTGWRPYPATHRPHQHTHEHMLTHMHTHHPCAPPHITHAYNTSSGACIHVHAHSHEHMHVSILMHTHQIQTSSHMCTHVCTDHIC